MIELALVVPLLALLAFGVAEFGTAWIAQNRIEGAVSTAARVGSSNGQLIEADVNVILSLKGALPAEAWENLDRVVIFRAGPDGRVPSACVPAPGSTSHSGVSGVCNSYAGQALQSITRDNATALGSSSGSTGPANRIDRYWCPTQRRDRLSGPPDSLGVWVRTTHENITGTFWGDFTITRQSVYRIQPDIEG